MLRLSASAVFRSPGKPCALLGLKSSSVLRLAYRFRVCSCEFVVQLRKRPVHADELLHVLSGRAAIKACRICAPARGHTGTGSDTVLEIKSCGGKFWIKWLA